MKDDKLANLFALLELLCRPQGCSIREAEAALGIDRKTFYRQLKTLDAIAIPYDKRPDVDGPTNSQRYFVPRRYLQEQGPRLLRLSAEEGFLLRYLLHKDTLLRQSQMGRQLAAMREKLERLTLSDVGHDRDARVPPVYVLDRHRRHHTAVERQLFATILGAIEHREELAVTYTSGPDSENRRVPRTFRLRPYTLLDYNGAFYVLGAEPGHDRPVPYSLDRFDAAAPVRPAITFTIPEDFTLEGYLENAFGICVDDHPVRIRLRFKWYTWTALTDRTWGRDQTLTRRDDGDFELSFTACQTVELEAWIRGFADGVVVLEPPELRDAIRAAHQRAAAQYGE